MKKPYSAHRICSICCLMVGLVSFSITAHADYLIPPQIDGFREPSPPTQIKHHHKIQHYKSYRYKCDQCAPREIVQFKYGQAPRGHGRYVDNVCENYAPDLATGDDDPTIYPDLNINN